MKMLVVMAMAVYMTKMVMAILTTRIMMAMGDHNDADDEAWVMNPFRDHTNQSQARIFPAMSKVTFPSALSPPNIFQRNLAMWFFRPPGGDDVFLALGGAMFSHVANMANEAREKSSGLIVTGPVVDQPVRVYTKVAIVDASRWTLFFCIRPRYMLVGPSSTCNACAAP